MIFADLHYEKHYSDVHLALVTLLVSEFNNVQHGLQGDSLIWVFEGGDKVEIDTFYSMKHQIKCSNMRSRAVEKVIEVLRSEYVIFVYSQPEQEPHEV